MNLQQEMRITLRDEDAILQHDLRVMSAQRDADNPNQLRLVVEDAYGSFDAFYCPKTPIDPEELVGNAYLCWGYPIDHEHLEHGLVIEGMEQNGYYFPTLFLVPQSACAPAAVPALHGLIDVIWGMEHRVIAWLMHCILGKSEVYPHFFTAAAARTAHHAYEGGLAVHSLECAQIVASLPEHFFSNSFGRDIAIAAAMLHDIGKIAYDQQPSRGSLVNHENHSLLVIAKELKELERSMGPNAADQLAYLLGKEARSAYACSTEAIAVMLADRLSATADAKRLAFKGKPEECDTAWRTMGGRKSKYVRLLNRPKGF